MRHHHRFFLLAFRSCFINVLSYYISQTFSRVFQTFGEISIISHLQRPTLPLSLWVNCSFPIFINMGDLAYLLLVWVFVVVTCFSYVIASCLPVGRMHGGAWLHSQPLCTNGIPSSQCYQEHISNHNFLCCFILVFFC